LSPLAFERQLGAMISGWGEALSIEFEASPHVLKLVSADQNAAACAIEVLREAINNAAKYASEPRLKVLLETKGNQFLALTVVNPVSEPALASSAGYGTKILDEVTHSWNLKTENDQAVFTALVALSN
jgi:two-component sensor histidine kinase